MKYEAMGVKGTPEKKYDTVILSHTLEHIYKIAPMLDRVKAGMFPWSLLVIEVPIHRRYKEPKEYDYHWQHINKFRPTDLSALLLNNGFIVSASYKIFRYNEYECWRIVGRLE